MICVNHADKNGKDIMHARWRKTASFTQMDGAVRVERVGRWFSVSRLEICPQLISRLRVATEAVDIVHLHTPNPLMLAAWWLAGNRNVPLLVTHHSDVVKQRFLNLFVVPIEKKVYRKACKILSDSPNYIEGSEVLQAFAGKVTTLPLGIDLDPYLSPSESILNQAMEIRGENGNPLWLMVGRMTYYKGYQVALEALAKVEGRLIIVGDGPLGPELRSQAEQLGVAGRIVWLSSVSQERLIALYKSATALWFPSIARSEGFGLVQVEAMACGCPVINTAIPGSGVSWVSLDGESGLTVTPKNPDDFAKKAQILTKDVGLLKSLSNGARQRASRLFDSETMAKKSIGIYRSVIH